MFVISFNFIKSFFTICLACWDTFLHNSPIKLPCCLKISFPVSLYLSVTAEKLRTLVKIWLSSNKVVVYAEKIVARMFMVKIKACFKLKNAG